jgi:F0F1-type ATP synthase assembly protein I
MKPADWLEILRYLSLITGIGLSFIAPVLLGWWLGAFLEARLSWGGWFIISLLLGVCSGAGNAYFLLKNIIPWE